MIKGEITNKLKGVKWPTTFAAVPNVGDYVVGKRENGKEVQMSVSSIAHSITQINDNAVYRVYTVPYILIKLT